MIAGYSLREPFEWAHEEEALPRFDPAWDAPNGIDPATLPLAERPALEAYRSTTEKSLSHTTEESR